MIIHVLYRGTALCKFSELTPVNWPSDHKWAHITERHLSNCADCLAKAEIVLKPDK